MKCKNCQAELQEDISFCPYCGTQLEEQTQQQAEAAEPVEIPEETMEQPEAATEETEDPGCEDEAVLTEEVPARKPKMSKTLKIILAAAGAVVLVVALAVGIFLAIRANSVMCKKSYTVADAAALEKGAVVVATVGSRELTNGQLQIYYWNSVSEFLNYYSSHLSAMGLDYTKPFDKQIYDEKTGKTYQQLFLENALESWRRYATLMAMAEEDGFTLSAEDQATVDSFEKRITEMAAAYGYTDPELFLQEQMAPGTTLEGYVAYLTENFASLAYYDTLYEGLLPTDQEVEAYFSEHEQEFTDSGITKDSGKYYDVRHILVPIEGGTKDEDGKTVYSDADWKKCREKAQQLLDEFLEGEATEEVFAAMAAEHSTDGGSNTNGGLYAQLTKGTNFVESFKNWYLNETRKPGDTGIVESVHGCHIMYFSDSYDIWKFEAKGMLVADRTSEMLEDAQEQWPMKVSYGKIVLGNATPTAS